MLRTSLGVKCLLALGLLTALVTLLCSHLSPLLHPRLQETYHTPPPQQPLQLVSGALVRTTINQTQDNRTPHNLELTGIEQKGKSEGNNDSLDFNDPYLLGITPKDWVEVKKTKPKKTVTKKTGKRQEMKGFTKSSKVLGYSPETLKERAKTFPESSPMRVFLKEQKRRISHIHTACRALQPSLAEIVAGSRGPPLGLMSIIHIIYDRTNQLTFCPVYKAASSSWTWMLLQLSGQWTPEMQDQSLQKLLKMFYPKLSGQSIPSVTRNTTHFMMVRHPLERLLSCYRDKIQNASKDYYYKQYGEKIIKRYRQSVVSLPREKILMYQQEVRVALRKGGTIDLPDNPFANPLGPTFPEFVKHVLSTKYDDEHWRTYNSLCAPCSLTYDFVLRFESLQEEREQFLEYINRTADARLRWDNQNSNGDTKNLACDYYGQLSDLEIDGLIAKYRKDLLLYEYDAEEYRKCARDYGGFTPEEARNVSHGDIKDDGGGGGYR